MKRRILLILLALVTAAGCASLPDTSAPQAIGTVARQPVNAAPPQPAPGREPDLLLRDFFKAGTNPGNRHIAARQFLTADASARWDDAASATIIDTIGLNVESRTNDRAVFVARGARVGQLEPGGIYVAAEGGVEVRIGLARVNGQWRIDQLPPGVIMERAKFVDAYQRKSLYFLDPAGTTMVPDQRWISAPQDQMAAQLIGLLVDGPKPALAPAVRDEFGDKISIRGPITKADGRTSSVGVGLGGIKVDFQGVGDLDPTGRELLAAQVVWTLATADITGPYVLFGEGQPLDERLAGGWSTADVAAYNPLANPSTDIGLHALRDGKFVKVDEHGTTPTPGYFGSVDNLRSLAMSRDGSLIAAVADSGRNTLMVGTYDGTAFPVAEGEMITRPSWAADDNAAWVAIDGTKVIRAVRDKATAQVSVADVDAAEINALGDKITELRLSRDGVRAGLIVGGKVYVAVVVPLPSGGFKLTEPRPVAIGLGSPAVSLDWTTGDTIVIARAASDTPVVMATVDGSRLDKLPSENLTPPVIAVDANATSEFVADSRAVFQLNNADPASDRYWREVPGLSGTRAIPVLPG